MNAIAELRRSKWPGANGHAIRGGGTRRDHGQNPGRGPGANGRTIRGRNRARQGWPGRGARRGPWRGATWGATERARAVAGPGRIPRRGAQARCEPGGMKWTAGCGRAEGTRPGGPPPPLPRVCPLPLSPPPLPRLLFFPACLSLPACPCPAPARCPCSAPARCPCSAPAAAPACHAAPAASASAAARPLPVPATPPPHRHWPRGSAPSRPAVLRIWQKSAEIPSPAPTDEGRFFHACVLAGIGHPPLRVSTTFYRLPSRGSRN